MSFRSLHFAKAASQIKATTSIVELAKLEAEELAGGEHRRSLVEDFGAAAKALVAGITEDDHLEILDILAGKSNSIILAALEGDSRDNDDTGPGETREGGESPSEAADRITETPFSEAAETLERAAGAAKEAAKILRNVEPTARRIVGRLARKVLPDGSVAVSGFTALRRRSE